MHLVFQEKNRNYNSYIKEIKGTILLITNLSTIGFNLYKYRKGIGLTQAEAAEKAEISDKTYADIEHGNVNLRIETTAFKILNTYLSSLN